MSIRAVEDQLNATLAELNAENMVKLIKENLRLREANAELVKEIHQLEKAILLCSGSCKITLAKAGVK